jgi:hypothetical protein
MNTSKFLLLAALFGALFMVVPATAFVPTFTGNAETDFPAVPGVLIIPDPGGQEIIVGGAPPGTISGWDIKDLRLAYDNVNDILYVGVNSYGIVGDADGDGDPGHETWGGGTDWPDLESTETVAVYFDLDMVGPFSMSTSWDVIVGVGSDMIFSDFGIYNTLTSSNPSSNFGTQITGHDGLTPTNPSAASPDWEFSITNFSSLLQDSAKATPDIDPGSFRVGAFMGSIEDGSIGEDYIYYHQIPSTITTVTPTASAIIEGGTVSLDITEENDSTAVRGEILGPLGPTIAMPYSFFPAAVAVTQNGSPIAASPLGAPPDSGDTANTSVLDIGETWVWTVSSDAITAGTTFVARGSGTGPIGFVHTYVEDSDEEAQADVDVLSTDVGISADPTSVQCDETSDLTVTEHNDGTADLTSPQVIVTKNGGAFATLGTGGTPPDSGDTSDPGVLNAGETWVWTISSGILDTATNVFVATGSAHYDGTTVDENNDADEQAEVTVTWTCFHPDTTVDIKANGSDGPIMVCEGDHVTLSICEDNSGDVELTDVHVEFSVDGVITALNPPLDKDNPTLTGDDGDGVMQDDETWCWTVMVTPTASTTIYDAIGHGLDPSGNDVTFPAVQTEYDDVEVDTQPCGGEGCTPGFWKNNAKNWEANAWCADYDPDQSFSSVFGVTIKIFTGGNPKSSSNYITNPSLYEALGANGGGINALARDAVAALLNTCSDCVQYAYSDVGELITDVHDAILAGDAAIDALHVELDGYNNAGCPIDQHGRCSHPID